MDAIDSQCAFTSTLDLNYFNMGEKKKNLTVEELLKRGNKIHQLILKSRQLDNEKFYKAINKIDKLKYQFGAQ